MNHFYNALRPRWLHAFLSVMAVMVLALSGVGQSMATPLAGTVIGNQAAATYTDASAIPRTATSNTVTTTVQQVKAFTLTASQSKQAAPGAPVNFPHTITNTGNGTDSFTLSVVNTPGTAGLVLPVFYIDANCDGNADNAIAITSVSGIAPGGHTCFVATTQVSGAAANASTGSFVITAATGATTATNTDTVTVTSQAVISVTKSISAPSGPTGTNVTYTLSYTNTGNSAATNVVLADFLPAGMTYVPGSALLNGVAVTDAALDDAYDFNITVAGRVTAVLPSVATGQSGTLSFHGVVAALTPPSTLNNQARFCYNDGAGQQPVACTTANAATSATAGSGNPTNVAPFTVLQTAAVVADDIGSTTDATPGGDTVTVASAAQGSSVVFDNVIHNNGNGTDTFNITMSAGNFPTGTTFLLLKSDGVTPLTDTNSVPDGVVDTGPVPAGGTYHVFVKAILPSGPAALPGPYNVVKTATSSFNPAVFDTVTDSLTAITPNTVDLTNNTAGPAAPGNGQGAEAAPVITNTTLPASSTTFTLVVNNTSGVADTYGFSYGSSGGVVAAGGPVSGALPAGWTVTFLADGGAGNCSTTAGTVANTGIVSAAGSKVVCAVVTVPANSPPVTASPVYFQVLSPTTGAKDVIFDAVTISTVRNLTLTPNNSGQIYPTGSLTYTHTLSNNGNVTEGGAGSTITLTDPMSGLTVGWSDVVYLDTNNNGVLDPADTAITGSALPVTIAAGASVRLFVKVLAPGSAAAGDVNTATLTATTTNGTYITAVPAVVTANDITTVIAGQVTLFKVQALDADCNGVADTGYSTATITTGAIPGACVLYQVTATNVGTGNVTSVVVSDATPSNTVYNTGAVCPAAGAVPAATTLGVMTPPTNCAAGTVSAAVGTLTPGQSAVVTFGVQINP